MFEIIMLFAFFYAATSQLLPRPSHGDKPGLSRSKCIQKKALEWFKNSSPKQKVSYQTGQLLQEETHS